MTLGDLLVKNNVIDHDTLVKSQKEATNRNVHLEDILISKGISETEVVKAKSEVYGIPARDLASSHVSFDVLRYIPEESARHYKFIPIGVNEGVLEVGMVYPDNTEAREALQFLSSKLNFPFKIFVISPSDLATVLGDYKSLGGEAEKVLGELESTLEEQKLVDIDKPSGQAGEQQKFVEDAPATKMVAVVLRHAVEGNASDVHIEPFHDRIKIRFRVDGILHTSLLLPLGVHEALIARIKILTNMKLDEKRKPQDGRFEAKIGKRVVDFRVSTFPTFFGEKAVLRILDPDKGLRTLEEVGLSGRNLEAIVKGLERPYGMILLTGPTGSGKTTTLYSMLQRLDKEKFNIVSLEDPIEYNIEGVSQSQVRPEIDYTFANGLRSILRQDPDMIMVGEIRDKETARLAIQAALTGHLVFSTLHTNNAIGVIPRLIDMGIDPYLIAPTLILAIAQRLTRTLCADSKKPVPISGSVKASLEKEFNEIPQISREDLTIPKEIYRAAPSVSCPRGTRGRTGVFEVLSMTPELEQIILTSPSENAIYKEAKRQGMITMRQDGILKVIKGLIGMDQLYEVT